eukprot:6196572-Pleurochrysis_carterae.AAC.1
MASVTEDAAAAAGVNVGAAVATAATIPGMGEVVAVTVVSLPMAEGATGAQAMHRLSLVTARNQPTLRRAF